MAKMIPPYVDISNLNRGENLVFDLFKEQTPEEWIVLHSLNIPESEQGFGSEIDFVVLAPDLGIFCLEVKGGSICRKDGVWIISDGQGRYYEKTISPLQQAAEGMYNLKDLIRKRLGPKSKYSQLFVSYGFIFTGNEYDVEDAETEAGEFTTRGIRICLLKITFLCYPKAVLQFIRSINGSIRCILILPKNRLEL